MKRAYFIDVQGTLLKDDTKEPIDGAIEFIDTLNRDNAPYVVITNNTKIESKTFLEELEKKGFNIRDYIDPFFILKEHLALSSKVAAFGDDKFLKVLDSIGYKREYKNPDSLLIGIKEDYTNEDYASMIEFALKCESSIFAMHKTSTYSKNQKRYPGVGAIMQMLKYATNRDYRVVGKPSFEFYEKARELIASNYEEINIISDDFIGDLLGAKSFGMNTTLVLSGKTKSAKELGESLKDNEKPDFICRDMREVLELYKKGDL